MRYGRDAERESDRAGVAYAGFADYDAAQGARFFRALRMLGEQSGQSVPGFLSTHPDPGEREQTILQLAAQGQSGTRVEARAYLNQIEGIVLGNDPRQGFAEGGRFYHPELRFSMSFPQGWQMQNTPSAVQFANPNGGAGAQLTLAQQASAADAARAFGTQQGVQVTDSRSLSVQGNRAARVEGTVTSQSGALGFTATFIEHQGNVYQIVGFGTAAVYPTVVGSLRSMADSFGALTDSRYLSRQPVRLEVVTLSRPATLQSLLAGRTLPDGVTAAEFGIMNQVSLAESLPAGTMVKLPR
jgi:predicted Zn-dependent protease